MIRLPPPKHSAKQQSLEKPLPPPTSSTLSSQVSSLEVVTRGRNNVKTSLNDSLPAGPDSSIQRVLLNQDETEVAKKTSNALAKIIEKKVAVTNQTSMSIEAAQSNPTSNFIKVNGGVDATTGKVSQDRIIRVAQKAVDPLSLALTKYRAAPKPPGSPPVPILHSPRRKATEEEKADWDVPKCVSNWNNTQGHVISLEKRLAQTTKTEAPVINDHFAKLSEALLTTEGLMSTVISERTKAKQENEEKRRLAENEELRIAAAEARNAKFRSRQDNEEPINYAIDKKGRDESSSENEKEEEDDIAKAAKAARDRLRLQRKRELDREMKLEQAGKRTKAMREEERDVSEKIALGLPVPKSAGGSLESEFDQRLFNRGESGLSSGRQADDEDNIYSTSLFSSSSRNIYKPSQSLRDNKSASEIQSKLDELKGRSEVFETHGFKGSESQKQPIQREGPVQFEKVEGTKQPTFSDDPLLHGISLSAAHRKASSVLEGLSNRAPTMSSLKFGRSSIPTTKPSLDIDEQEEAEDRYIKKLQEKESRSKKISFVKGSES